MQKTPPQIINSCAKILIFPRSLMLFEPVVGGQDLRDRWRATFFSVVHEPKEPRKFSQDHRMAGSRCRLQPPAVEEERRRRKNVTQLHSDRTEPDCNPAFGRDEMISQTLNMQTSNSTSVRFHCKMLSLIKSRNLLRIAKWNRTALSTQCWQPSLHLSHNMDRH